LVPGKGGKRRMQRMGTIAARIWPIAASAVISVALFRGIAFGSERITVWLLTHAVPHERHSPFPILFAEGTFLAVFIPAMIAAGRRQRKPERRRPITRSW